MAAPGIPITSLLQRSPTLADAVAGLAPAQDLLAKLSYDDVSTNINGDHLSIWLSLIVDGQLAFDLPGGFAIAIGEGDGYTPLVFGIRISPAGVGLAIEGLAVVLAIPPSLLRPAPEEGVEAPERVEVVIGGGLTLDESRRLEVEGFDSAALPRSFVGGTSIVISAEDVAIDTSQGLVLGEARIELPKDLPQLAPEELLLEDAVIGPSGVTGRLSATYTPEFDDATKHFTGRGSGELGGVSFAFSAIAIELRDNDLVEASLAGELVLPFFETRTGVAITLRADGSFSIALGGGTPLATIERAGLMRLSVDHIAFEVIDGKLVVHTAGMVTLLVGDVEWPSFRADDMSIDADGNISVHGAGLVLRDGKPLDLGNSPTGGMLPGVTVDKLDLSGNPLGEGFEIDAELSTSSTVGPFTATLQQLGVHGKLVVDSTARLTDTTFRPPQRIAIAIDSDLVEGSGFVVRDPQADRYAGGLELEIKRVGVSGLALLEKREGRWSLLAVLAGRFPGVPLGFGFFLDGLGGVLATNRRADVDRLRIGLRDHTLDGVLFPDQLGTQALAMIERLGAAFPIAAGRTLIGPMFKIGWGVPRLVSGEIAIAVELPAPIRVLLLAQLHASLPTKERKLIVLNVDALGVLDLEARRAALDASLHDSKLINYDLTGDLVARFAWGEDPTFVVSVGGFHPRFEPPPELPALRRLALTIGSNPRITLEAYLAVTSNTAQIGAQAQIHVASSGFTVDGGVGFDALLQLDPFHFEVDVVLWAAVKWHGRSLAGVRVEGILAGPTPWHVRGSATFEVLGWEHSIEFDETFGRRDDGQLPPPPDPLTLVRTRFEDKASWWSDGATTGFRVVSRHDDAVIVDPQATLAAKQEAVPLDRVITRIGAARLAAPARVTIDAVRIDGNPVPRSSLEAPFAPAQFVDMSDAEKLAAPAFDAMPAGFRIDASTVRHGPGRRNVAIDYSEYIVDPEHRSPPVRPSRGLTAATFEEVLTPPRTPPPKRLVVIEPGWVLASTDDLSTADARAADFLTTRSRATDGSAIVVRDYEVERR